MSGDRGMLWHIVEGPEGCAFAKERNATAVIVDALRASATAAMLCHAGATAIHVVKTVDEALGAKKRLPGALLYGERMGLPPEGFDYGNSPRECAPAAGREIIFTTTNGAQRLVEAWGVPDLLMGTTTNARAVAQYAAQHNRDVVLVPAGPPGSGATETQEDWAAAAAIVDAASGTAGEGAASYARWRERMRDEGLPALFAGAPHAETLRRVHLDDDIAFCAQLDVTRCVPQAVRYTDGAVTLTGN